MRRKQRVVDRHTRRGRDPTTWPRKDRRPNGTALCATAVTGSHVRTAATARRSARPRMWLLADRSQRCFRWSLQSSMRSRPATEPLERAAQPTRDAESGTDRHPAEFGTTRGAKAKTVMEDNGEVSGGNEVTKANTVLQELMAGSIVPEITTRWHRRGVTYADGTVTADGGASLRTRSTTNGFLGGGVTERSTCARAGETQQELQPNANPAGVRLGGSAHPTHRLGIRYRGGGRPDGAHQHEAADLADDLRKTVDEARRVLRDLPMSAALKQATDSSVVEEPQNAVNGARRRSCPDESQIDARRRSSRKGRS